MGKKEDIIKASTIFILFFIAFTCRGQSEKDFNGTVLSEKKIFYIDSYHEGYEPGKAQRDAFFKKIKETGVEIQVFYLDARNHPEEKEMKAAGKKCFSEIKKFAPDLIIAADDPACTEVTAPFLAGGKIPVVFIGINWTAKDCSYPASNITGQIEVEFIKEMIDELKKYAKGEKISLLTADTFTDRKAVDYYVKNMGLKFKEIVFVKDFSEFKKHYLHIQKTSDALFFRNLTGIKNWLEDEAYEFILKETKIPSGSVLFHMPKFVLISYAKDNREFGEYAADTAIKILKYGMSPSKIKPEKNKRVYIKLNMTLAKKMHLIFSEELIEKAYFVEESFI